MLDCDLAASTTARPLASPSLQSVTTASYTLFCSFSMASCAEVDAVTVCPAASRIWHFRVTTWGSSSTHRILDIGRVLRSATLVACGVGCLASVPLQPRLSVFWDTVCTNVNAARQN